MMSSQKKLVPKLRFPEFRDSGEWEEKQLNKIYLFKVTNSFPRDKLNYTDGLVKNIHYGDIHTKFSTLFDITKEIVPYINPSIELKKIKSENYCIESDIIFADASEDLDDVGKSIEIINLNKEKLLSGLHTLLARQKTKKLITGFGGYLFKSPSIRNAIKRESQGAKVLSISANRLSNIQIDFPKDKTEQKKIANCLTSLDNLINAHNKKLNALTEHKKGLMQQLFPQEGERVPRLRFKGFSGEWRNSKFSNKDLLEVIDGDRGKNYPKANDLSSFGDCIFLNAKNVTKNAFSFKKVQYISHIKDKSMSKGKLKELDIVLTTRGTIGNLAYFSKDIQYKNMRINSGMVILRIITKKIDTNYFYYYCKSELISKIIKDIAFGNAQQQLTIADIKNIILFFPKPKEQEKIANCLSSIDKLITVEKEKIESLKEHKKGLMQQLFINSEVN